MFSYLKTLLFGKTITLNKGDEVKFIRYRGEGYVLYLYRNGDGPREVTSYVFDQLIELPEIATGDLLGSGCHSISREFGGNATIGKFVSYFPTAAPQRKADLDTKAIAYRFVIAKAVTFKLSR